MKSMSVIYMLEEISSLQARIEGGGLSYEEKLDLKCELFQKKQSVLMFIGQEHFQDLENYSNSHEQWMTSAMFLHSIEKNRKAPRTQVQEVPKAEKQEKKLVM